MSVTITIPDDLAQSLQKIAESKSLPFEKFILDTLTTLKILDGSHLEPLPDDDFLPSLDEIVAEIKALPFNPANVRPAQGSLTDVLKELEEAEPDPNFDAEAWNEAWAKIEAEMKAESRANELVSGIGA